MTPLPEADVAGILFDIGLSAADRVVARDGVVNPGMRAGALIFLIGTATEGVEEKKGSLAWPEKGCG